ncbi:MAG: gfo/Idh/MocA family oxidoreductase [Chlorobi bacterium CHB2]|nr:gfo/Idh/MocA family oxidoreductase [Chlorobi bacterium CHB2]
MDLLQPPFNIGIIGCGAIAREHLSAIQAIDGLRPYAYCDLHPERATALLHDHGGSYATSAPERLLGDPNIQALYICTHHDTHTQLAVAACKAGKHVMMEKPLALTVEECTEIGQAVEESGVRFMTGFKLRYNPVVLKLREFLPNPTFVMAQIMDARWPDDFWAQDPQKGGGNVLSQGCHAMDLACHLNGSDPTEIFAECGTRSHTGTEVMDSLVATIRFANGNFASVAIGDSGTVPYLSKFAFQAVGGGRSALLHDRLKRGEYFDGEASQTVVQEREMGMEGENREFLAALAEDRPPATGWRDGLRATAMVRAAFRAAETRMAQPLTLPTNR